jgi:hypothetical protein
MHCGNKSSPTPIPAQLLPLLPLCGCCASVCPLVAAPYMRRAHPVAAAAGPQLQVAGTPLEPSPRQGRPCAAAALPSYGHAAAAATAVSCPAFFFFFFFPGRVCYTFGKESRDSNRESMRESGATLQNTHPVAFLPPCESLGRCPRAGHSLPGLRGPSSTPCCMHARAGPPRRRGQRPPGWPKHSPGH